MTPGDPAKPKEAGTDAASEDAGPLVSCIMPTRNRLRFVEQAVAYFLRQDYPRRELIIVDDGQDAAGGIIPLDSRIRYIRLDRPATAGAKRNIACRESRGSLIAHWDDDDWMAPDRLSKQVARLLASHAFITAPAGLLHYAPMQGGAWHFSSPAGGEPRLPRGPLLYRRSLWEGRPFPDTDHGEERALVDGLDAGRVLWEPGGAYYIKILHEANTAPLNPHDPCWQRRSLYEVVTRMGGDIDFYARLRTPDRLPSGPRAVRLTVAAPFLVYDGYGSVAEYIVRGFLRAGVEVDVVPFRLDRAGMSPEFLAALQRSCFDPTSPALCFCWPLEDLSRFEFARDLFVYTMWESSRLPDGWAAKLNRARAVMVPTPYVAGAFRASGVTVPIEVVRQGVDPDVYPYIARPRRRGITTLTVGTFVPRKNIEIGIRAWKEAFADDPHARLIIKSRFQARPYAPDDPRIRFVDTEEASRGILHWYRQADVLLALGNEGFGLPLVEGMATGLPVIALNAEGQADVCEQAGNRLLPVAPDHFAEFDPRPFGPCGRRAVPAVADVARRLRWVADYRDAAKAMGKAASRWVRKHRNLWDMPPRLLEAMERHSRFVRPFSRVPAGAVTAAGPAAAQARRQSRLAGGNGS